MTQATNLWVSIRRTAVPIVVGAVMASAAGPVLDAQLVTEAVVALFAVLYYVVMRVLEFNGFRWASLALGSTLTPHYDVDTGVLAEVPVDERLADDSGSGSIADEDLVLG